MDRRSLIAGATTLPLLSGAEAAAQSANGTDAAWAEYQAAKAAYETTGQAYDALDATLPDHLKGRAHPHKSSMEPVEWRRAMETYNRGRAEHGAEALAKACDETGERYCDADRALQEAPAWTLTDVERKLAAAHDFETGLDPDAVEEMLAVVRRINGRAA